MKQLLLIYLCLVCTLQAIELKSMIEDFGECKKVTLNGNIIWTLHPVQREDVTFQTEDPSKIKAIMSWIKGIPATEQPTRLYGHQLPVSADEALVFKFAGKDNVEHRVVIFSKFGITVEADRQFKVRDMIDIQPLFAIIRGDGKGGK